VLPHDSSARDVLAADVDGVVLSPGPGDPARLTDAVELTRAILADGRPLLGICLGHQLIALAAGGTTRRLPFGHHGANHPVQDADDGTVRMTAQNHEMEVVAGSLRPGSGLRVTRLNLNDGSVEGLRDATGMVETVQYHPEGAPGPRDDTTTFDAFVERAARTAAGRKAAVHA
jgi:carbamoyl-phosphate synthase small subunit